jgi:4-diphosphocytidyl-2-C-methyl-D-erythritol kinase
MKEIRVSAFAKVNLRLEILGRRADGYHELRTIFQSLTLHDSLHLAWTSGRGIDLHVAGDAALAAAPARDNLVWRALSTLHRELKLRRGIRAELRKRIPAGRGLGGGSSDAAAALAGLLRLSGERIAPERLMEMASGLGADVPFFLSGGRALGASRGDEIYPLPELPRRTVLVVSPRDIGVNTRQAYGWLDRGLTTRARMPRLWAFCALCWSPSGGALRNDFEAPVFRRHARLSRIKRRLLEQGAADASLAGSGSAVFGIFTSPVKARRAARMFPEDAVFLCATLSRQAYSRALWGSYGSVWTGEGSRRRQAEST